jgi:hypothetical protein
MKHRRIAVLSIAAAMSAATCLAVTSPAYADEDPIVKLVSGQSQECLQPAGESHELGVAIVQVGCNGHRAQQWTKTGGVFSDKNKFINRESGLCLDARGGAMNGTPIQQWACGNITNENWSVGGAGNKLISRVSNTWSHCIATPGIGDNLAMELRVCNTDSSQIWNEPPG